MVHWIKSQANRIYNKWLASSKNSINLRKTMKAFKKPIFLIPLYFAAKAVSINFQETQLII